MKELKASGLPISFLDNGALVLDDSLQIEGSGTKSCGDMSGMLHVPGYLPDEELYYNVYRGITHPGDEKLFAEKKKRYDITAINSSPEQGECKKTSGHFHKYLPDSSISYPEVYEVHAGTAMYILVKVKDHTVPVEQLEVLDVRLVTVEAGQTIIIPPNYGHAAINAGTGPMIFSNICTLRNTSSYAITKHFHGMPYYVEKVAGQIHAVKNDRWTMECPMPRMMKVKENAHLGIIFNHPVYKEFMAHPERFEFLDNPTDYVDEIMDMMIDA